MNNSVSCSQIVDSIILSLVNKSISGSFFHHNIKFLRIMQEYEEDGHFLHKYLP